MSIRDKVNQLAAQYEAFKRLDFDLFFRAPGNYQPWDGFSLDDFRSTVEYVRSLIDDGLTKKVFDKLSVAGINALINAVANVAQQCQQLFANPGNQQQFQNASAHVDALLNTLLQYDIPLLVSGGADLDRMRALYDSEAQRLAQLKATADDLNRSIKNLIEPAVSGSLSKSFSDRRRSLYIGRLFWFAISWAGFGLAIFYTMEFVNAAQSLLQQATNKEGLFWPTLLLRSIILLPIYIGVVFGFSQYKKERDLEEEYAHKAAVAATLPNYGDLAKDIAVKDQIVTGASNVIFTSPISKVQHYDKDALPLEGMKGIIDSIGKAIKRQ